MHVQESDLLIMNKKLALSDTYNSVKSITRVRNKKLVLSDT